MTIHFYIKKCTSYSQTMFWVVAARPIDPINDYLVPCQRTNEYINNYLKVVQPSHLRDTYIEKKLFIECIGSVRALGWEEWFTLNYRLDPTIPVPNEAKGLVARIDEVYKRNHGKRRFQERDEYIQNHLRGSSSMAKVQRLEEVRY